MYLLCISLFLALEPSDKKVARVSRLSQAKALLEVLPGTRLVGFPVMDRAACLKRNLSSKAWASLHCQEKY